MKKILCSSAVILFAVATLQAGWIVKQATTDDEGVVMEETVYFQDNKIRNDSEEQSMVMDLNSGQMIMINHANQKYWQGNYSSMMQQSKDAAKEQMDKMMENMTEEQKEAYQQYMDQMENSPDASDESEAHNIKIKSGNATETVQGYPAQLYEVWVDSEKAEDLWISEALPVMKEIDMNKFSEFLDEMTWEEGGEYSYENSDEYRNLIRKGFPLKTIEYSPMGNTSITVTSIKSESIPNSEFTPPSGYTEVSMQGLWEQ